MAGQPERQRSLVVAFAMLLLNAGALAQGIGPEVPDTVPAVVTAPETLTGDPTPSSTPVAPPRTSPRADPGRRQTVPAIEATPLGTPAGRAAAGAAAQAGAQQTPPPASNMSYARTLGALSLVVILIIGLALLARRLARRGGLLAQLGAGGRAPSGVLEVLGRFPAGRGCTLVLLKLDRRVLLVCQTTGKGLMGAHAMSTLCEITEPEQVASILVKVRDEQGDSIARRFQEVLAGADDRTARDMDEHEPASLAAQPAPHAPAAARVPRPLAAAPVVHQSRDMRDMRDMRDTRDPRLVGPAQPLATAKSRPPSPKATVPKPISPRPTSSGLGAPAPSSRVTSADPALERVRGRVAALRSTATGRPLEVRA